MRALLVIDVQNDFTEGGALGVEGGAAVATGVTEFLRQHPNAYDVVFASRDWHDAVGDNGGHFAIGHAPDFVTTWPVHCVAGTRGAEYHPGLDESLLTEQVRKGQGRPAYSIFEGTTVGGISFAERLDALAVSQVDVVGIATDYCVRASALDAVSSGRAVRVFRDLVVGVAAHTSTRALTELAEAGVEIIESRNGFSTNGDPDD